MSSPRRHRWLLLVGVLACVFLVRLVWVSEHERSVYAVATLRSLTVRFVLDPLDDRWRARPFGADFDVTSKASVIVRNGDRYYEIFPPYRQGAFTALPTKEPIPSSLAVDPDDTALVVTEGYFGKLDEDGQSVEAVPLLSQDMRVAHSVVKGVVYVFGRVSPPDKPADYRLYAFGDDGSLRILASGGDPIVSVSDNEQAIYFATANAIYRLDMDLERKQITQRLHVSDHELGGPIACVAAGAGDDVVFFSTLDKVYALRGEGAVSIVNNSGGALRLRGQTLYVLDGRRGLLYTLEPATRALFAEGR